MNNVVSNKKEFEKLFNALNPSLTRWQVWEHVVNIFACALSNSVEPDKERYEKREDSYKNSMETLGMENSEIVSKMFALLMEAYFIDPEQDFLGEMFMALGLGNHWAGQYFTPYNVASMMSRITASDTAKDEVKKKGYISTIDSCCGSGVMLIAARNTYTGMGIDVQKDVMFVGQDVDRLAAQMCFIQLSLLGCAGYVVVANSLTNPVTGASDILPHENECQEFWYTPFFWTRTWTERRRVQLEMLKKMAS